MVTIIEFTRETLLSLKFGLHVEYGKLTRKKIATRKLLWYWACTLRKGTLKCLNFVFLPTIDMSFSVQIYFSNSPDRILRGRRKVPFILCAFSLWCIFAGSLRHLVVLTSDNVLRVYCQDDLSIAEQSFSLQLSHDRYPQNLS